MSKRLLNYGAILLGLVFIPVGHAAQNNTCSDPDANDKPIMALQLGTEALKEEVLYHFEQQWPKIVESIKALELRDLLTGWKPQACAEMRSTPGFDSKTGCLYLPEFLFNPDFKSQTLKTYFSASRALAPNIDKLQINDLGLQKLELDCQSREGETICRAQAKIEYFSIQSHFQLFDSTKKHLLLTTTSPLKVELKPHQGRHPTVSLKLRLRGSGSPANVLKVVENSLQIHAEPKMVDASFNIDQMSVVDHYHAYAKEKLGIREIDSQNKADELYAFMETPEAQKYLEALIRSQSIFTYIDKLRTSNDNLIQKNFAPIMKLFGPSLSKLVTSIIEDELPLEEHISFYLPADSVADSIGEDLYSRYIEEIHVYLDEMDTLAKSLRPREKRDFRRNHTHKLNKYLNFVRNLKDSYLPSIGDKLTALSERLSLHRDRLVDLGLFENGVKKALRKLIEKSQLYGQILSSYKDNPPAYKASSFRLGDITSIRKDGLFGLINACHIGGQVPNTPVNWVDTIDQTITLPNPLSYRVEIPFAPINQYLTLLNDNNFFDFCLGKKDSSCAENNKSIAHSLFRYKKPPQLYTDGSNSYLLIDEIERSSNSRLPNFIDRDLLGETSQIRVCLDLELVDGEFKFPENCISGKSKVGKNFRPSHLLSLVNPILAAGVVGLRLTHSGIQQGKLNEVTNPDNMSELFLDFLASGRYPVTRIKSVNDRLIIEGRINPDIKYEDKDQE